jgi:predicted phage tail component-like protein|nr:MAG TPA: distal tail protein [Caudoviricetes sp.]
MYNYFNFNGTQINDLAIVTSIEKPYIPEKSIDTISVSSRDGEIFDGAKYDPISIPISLVVIGDNEEDYKTRVQCLHDLLSTKQEVPIKFCENITIYGMLKGSLKVKKKNSVSGYADIELICHTPYSYSDNVQAYNAEDNAQTVVVENNGEVATLPYVSIGFGADAHFAQLQNNKTGEKILVGDYPQLQLSTTKKEQTLILHDPCESVGTLIQSGANINSGRGTGGSFTISSSGNSFILSELGSSSTEKIKGACARINLSKNIDDFKVMVRMQCRSSGKNGDPNNVLSEQEKVKETVVEGGKVTYYEVTANGVNYRTQPSTKGKSQGIIPKGTKLTDVTIQNGWAKIKYKTKTYYVSAKYIKKQVKDNSKSVVKEFTVANMWLTPSKTLTGGSCAVYTKPNPGSKVECTIPYGTKLRIIQRAYTYKPKDSNSASQTITYYRIYKPWKDKNGKKHTGYINVDYLKGAAAIDNSVDYSDDPAYADHKTGIAEVYGFDVNGTQIFRLYLGDINPYFEYNQAEVSISKKSILITSNDKPNEKTDQTVDNNGKIVTNHYMSGKHGSWNDANAYFTLTRKKTGKNYVYSAQVQKNEDGKFTQSVSANNKRSSEYSTNALSYLAIYIGTMADSLENACGVGISDIKVYELNPESEEQVNVKYFESGDKLDLDFENGDCYLNNELRNDLVDIGSIYFTVDEGETTLQVVSDDTTASLGVLIREKWLGVVDEDRSTPPQDLNLTSE